MIHLNVPPHNIEDCGVLQLNMFSNRSYEWWETVKTPPAQAKNTPQEYETQEYEEYQRPVSFSCLAFIYRLFGCLVFYTF